MIRTSPAVPTQADPRSGSRRMIPFDYAFRYKLEGKRGQVLNSTVSVSIEATFVAVAIGYGVMPKVEPIRFGIAQPDVLEALAAGKQRITEITLGQIVESLEKALPNTSRILKKESGPEAVLKNGIQLNPDVAEKVLDQIDKEVAGTAATVSPRILENLFQVVGAPPDLIQFEYALFDEGSGREFQSEPILSTAGLGISNGDRPFRQFARPIAFAPRSTIRLEVREISELQGTLFVSLHGYKVLGGAGTPTGRSRLRAVAVGRPG